MVLAADVDERSATLIRHIPTWKNLGVYASRISSLVPDTPPSFLTAPVLRPMKVVDLATHTSALTHGFMMRTAVDAALAEAAAESAVRSPHVRGQRRSRLPRSLSPTAASTAREPR